MADATTYLAASADSQAPCGNSIRATADNARETVQAGNAPTNNLKLKLRKFKSFVPGLRARWLGGKGVWKSGNGNERPSSCFWPAWKVFAPGIRGHLLLGYLTLRA
ncbi:hypothetical protein KM043_006627 [Ampulex compressa]|nr:hypothetical protein KM043_006627 [Ampulex compressa]